MKLTPGNNLWLSTPWISETDLFGTPGGCRLGGWGYAAIWVMECWFIGMYWGIVEDKEKGWFDKLWLRFEGTILIDYFFRKSNIQKTHNKCYKVYKKPYLKLEIFALKSLRKMSYLQDFWLIFYYCSKCSLYQPLDWITLHLILKDLSLVLFRWTAPFW